MCGVKQGAMMLGAFTLMACGADSEATSPRLTIAGPSFSVVGDAGQRVTGSATILLPNFDSARERYGLTAIRHSDGSVTGEFEEFSEQEGGQRIHAHVVCFTVVGNGARLAAQIDETNVPFGPEGSYVVWSVI